MHLSVYLSVYLGKGRNISRQRQRPTLPPKYSSIKIRNVTSAKKIDGEKPVASGRKSYYGEEEGGFTEKTSFRKRISNVIAVQAEAKHLPD